MSKIYTAADQLIGHTPLLELTHIEKQENSEFLMAEFNEAQKQGKSKYPLAKKWFLEQFPNFKITEGKKAIGDAKIAKVKTNAKIVLAKTSANKKAS